MTDAQKKTTHAKLISQGVDSDEAWFRVEGYTGQQAKKQADSLKRKIDRQRIKAGKAPLYRKGN